MARWLESTNMQRAPLKTGHQAPGRSRGGLSTKIHAAVDALGNPLRCFLSGGEVADIAHAQALLAGFDAKTLLVKMDIRR